MCLLCGDFSSYGKIICALCKKDLPQLSNPCPRCGQPGVTGACNFCSAKKPLYDESIIVFPYQYPVTDLIKAAKYKSQLSIARELGGLLSEAVLQTANKLPECLVPVPIHPSRLYKRGFNQSQEIARVLANRFGLPLKPNLIKKTRVTAPQFELSPKQRLKNVKGAFKLQEKLAYKHLAIVDDVITTGSTLNEITQILKQAGAKSVVAWACARTI